MNSLAPGIYTFTFGYVTHSYTLAPDGYAEMFTVATPYQPAQLLRVVSTAELEARIDARCKFSPFTFSPAPVPTIGKARARKLHVLMARFGIVNHYAAAEKAVQHEVSSLAALTETEARKVWRYLKAHFIRTQEVAA